ncbi:hypothetical protein MSLAZ_3043 [Methanosarcina lacustris Z-7289]|uniref:Uncharacterized protein n=1 Tax=Methanosarcina lacustris Z-7289 TaxID=1434111 RepID=A0A0E3S5C3_9EURY|nr:hypothetical protein MSLAZ_3043 [Methanosarcina lacustris Z-7289]
MADLSTLKYNLDSLIAVGMIRVSEVKWSQRERKIKIYELVEKIMILVPGCRNGCRMLVLELLAMEGRKSLYRG